MTRKSENLGHYFPSLTACLAAFLFATLYSKWRERFINNPARKKKKRQNEERSKERATSIKFTGHGEVCISGPLFHDERTSLCRRHSWNFISILFYSRFATASRVIVASVLNYGYLTFVDRRTKRYWNGAVSTTLWTRALRAVRNQLEL